ncbi:hypothetical protein [Shinella sedimenti]|uniref:Methyltransferase FkbM domain-containing protein n=1 Tax=Shinella sedimenti TaxID=2919913 RepID=A0ABT0CS12_9HYPH|nr:hypothetical protein [Shinella sedimenti]MCJ8151395.1 hypothetical protein [Shinella sedimenti]
MPNNPIDNRPRKSFLDKRRLKMRLKRSCAFRVYDRLILSLAARLSSQLSQTEPFVGLGQRVNALQQQLDSIQSQTNEAVGLLARSVVGLERGQSLLRGKIEDAQVVIGGIEDKISESSTIFDHGYRVFSQWNEDGILQYLLRRIGSHNNTFIEIGVGDYSEANTRFLVQKDNWRGLIVDSDMEALDRFTNMGMRWKTNVDVKAAMVTSENINDIIGDAGYGGDIDIFSLDIDGMDYWVWKEISIISPRIVVCEYNALFGPDAAVTVPYDPSFDRRERHYTWTYAGASLGALKSLAAEKGYTLVTCNSGGNNAFFVRDDLLAASGIGPDDILFRPPAFRETRNEVGQLTFLSAQETLKLLAGMQVVDVNTGQVIDVADLMRDVI